MMEGSLAIERVELGYQAATSFERAGPVTARIGEAIARSLPDALAAATSRELDGDDRYVFIDRIDVRSSVAAHWSDDRIAGQLAEQVARALFHQLDAGEALIFRDRPEFVAAFAASMVDDGSAPRWWFDEFGGLMALPVSMRLRTLIVGEGRIGFEALARLSQPQLHRVLARIDADDLVRIIAALPDESVPPAGARALLEAVDAGDGAPLPSAEHVELAMLVHLIRMSAGGPYKANLAALRIVRALVWAGRTGLLPPPASDPAITLRRWLHAIGTDVEAALALLPDDRHQLIEGVMAQTGSANFSSSAVADVPETFDFTRFGGALLLCVVLARTGRWQAWQTAIGDVRPVEAASSLAATLALAVIARALDPRSVATIEGDAALRRAIGPDDWRAAPLRLADRRLLARALDETAGESGSRRGLEGRLGGQARALIAAFADRVPGCDGSTPGYVRRQLLSLHAGISSDGTQARLGRPPLDVLLVFSGLKRASVTLPHSRTLSLSGEMTP